VCAAVSAITGGTFMSDKRPILTARQQAEPVVSFAMIR
jgi:hypothetical protein